MINIKKYAIYFYLIVSTIAIIYFAIALHLSNSNGELDAEKALLEKERFQHLETRKKLHTEIRSLQKQNKNLKNKYIEALREYENTTVHTTFDSAIDEFFK